MQSNQSLLSPSEAAHYLACSIDTLKRWRRQNCGPRYVRLGYRKLVRYTTQDIEAFIASQTGGEK